MHITLSPLRHDAPLTLHRAGEVLSFNGMAVDFGPCPEGVTPRDTMGCPWLADDVRREGGVLHLVLLLPHGGNAPEETRFPAPLNAPPDGPVALPPHGDAADRPENGQ